MSIDHILAAGGLGLAIASAALPWHVWSHPDAYERPRIVLERLDDDPVMAAFAPRREAPLITGSVAPVDAAPTATASQPKLVFATATHALARLPGIAELTLLRPGSKIGNGDAVASIELRDGRWTLVTTRGRTLAVTR